jgi:hypothetical protein
MSILHAFVALDTGIVAEALSQDQSTSASQLLPQVRVLLATCARDVSPAMKRVSLEGNRTFLYLKDGVNTFGCIILASAPHVESEIRHGFDFLSAVKEAFTNSVAEDDLRSPFAAASQSQTFDLFAILNAWNGAASATNPDRIVQIEQGLDEATAQVAYNARLVHERGNKLDQLSVASSAVFSSADNYRAYAGELQEKAQRQRTIRLIAAGSCVAVVLLWLIL